MGTVALSLFVYESSPISVLCVLLSLSAPHNVCGGFSVEARKLLMLDQRSDNDTLLDNNRKSCLSLSNKYNCKQKYPTPLN